MDRLLQWRALMYLQVVVAWQQSYTKTFQQLKISMQVFSFSV